MEGRSWASQSSREDLLGLEVCKDGSSSRFSCGEDHLRFGDFILKVDLRVFQVDSNKGVSLQEFLLDLIISFFIIVFLPQESYFALGRGLLVLLVLFLQVLLLLSFCFNINEVSFPQLAVVKPFHQVVLNQFLGLLGEEELKSLD